MGWGRVRGWSLGLQLGMVDLSYDNIRLREKVMNEQRSVLFLSIVRHTLGADRSMMNVEGDLEIHKEKIMTDSNEVHRVHEYTEYPVRC